MRSLVSFSLRLVLVEFVDLGFACLGRRFWGGFACGLEQAYVRQPILHTETPADDLLVRPVGVLVQAIVSYANPAIICSRSCSGLTLH